MVQTLQGQIQTAEQSLALERSQKVDARSDLARAQALFNKEKYGLVSAASDRERFLKASVEEKEQARAEA